MTEARDLSSFMRLLPDGTATMTLAVEGVSCGGCMRRIESGLHKLGGVREARMNFTNRRLAVAWNPQQRNASDIVAAIARLGYDAHPFVVRNAEEADVREAQQLLKALGVAGFAAMNIMLLSVSVWSGNVTDISPETRDFFHWLSAAIALPACAYAGLPFFKSARAALKVRTTNMDVPISLGVLLALGLSLYETIHHGQHAYFDSPVMLLFFLLCGRYLDSAMRAKTRTAAGSLAALRAETAHKLDCEGQLVEIPASALKVGDCIVVRPGDRVPADGVVVTGSSQIDESLVTGETAWRDVKPGDAAYAGTRNFSGALSVRVTAAGEQTLLDEIERLLASAQQAKALTIPMADRAARLYAPVVHTAAALTFGAWLLFGATTHNALVIAISVLIITCPCALALAAPVVQVIAAGRLFRSGILLNAGDAIERFAEVDTVVFDKTGTLTLPDMHVSNSPDIPPQLLSIAARLALSSRHALAAAVARTSHERNPYPNVVEEPGAGIHAYVDDVEARLGSPAFCGMEALPPLGASASVIAFRYGEQRAVFQVQQTLRPDAVEIVHTLQAMGLTVQILSGDRAEAVEPIARALGIATWHAPIKPAEKVAALDALKREGRRVLMVGDGLNDAPALCAAHASASPISAAELSQANADAVFLGARLAPVAEIVTVARLARRLMVQNLAFAAAYNAVAVPIAMIGWVTPLIAALAMSASSIAVAVNAFRLHVPRKPTVAQRLPSGVLTQARWSAP